MASEFTMECICMGKTRTNKRAFLTQLFPTAPTIARHPHLYDTDVFSGEIQHRKQRVDCKFYKVAVRNYDRTMDDVYWRIVSLIPCCNVCLILLKTGNYDYQSDIQAYLDKIYKALNNDRSLRANSVDHKRTFALKQKKRKNKNKNKNSKDIDFDFDCDCDCDCDPPNRFFICFVLPAHNGEYNYKEKQIEDVIRDWKEETRNGKRGTKIGYFGTSLPFDIDRLVIDCKNQNDAILTKIINFCQTDQRRVHSLLNKVESSRNDRKNVNRWNNIVLLLLIIFAIFCHSGNMNV